MAGLGHDTIYTCSSLHAVNIDWLINGTLLSKLQLSNVVQSFDRIGGFGSLRFRNVPLEYNVTTVQCRANITSVEIITSQNSTLLVQGRKLNIIMESCLLC